MLEELSEIKASGVEAEIVIGKYWQQLPQSGDKCKRGLSTISVMYKREMMVILLIF